MRRLVVLAGLAAIVIPRATRAQDRATATAEVMRPASDSIFRRARRLVGDGNGAAGRALVDSLLKAAPPGSPDYGNALYWQGALASTAAEAELAYRRVIVEYPLSYYADDALLALAELEQARGDRAGALQHLQRFVREHPASPARGVAALAAARLAMEQRDTKTGCAMIAEARASVKASEVELTNQIAYYASRCPTATAAAPAVPPASILPPASATPNPVAATPTAPVSTPPSVDSAPRAPTRPAAPAPAAGRFTIQVAAYNTRGDAERYAAKLAAKGVKARVTGTSKPFRVRLGLFATRADAAAEVASLRKRGIVGFVAEESRSP